MQSPWFLLAVLLGLLLLLIVGVLGWAVWTFNRLVRARNQQAEAWSGIDVQLRKRHDLVPALVEVVKGYSAHEQTVLREVTEARREAVGRPERTDAAEQHLSQGLRHLFALAESYPQLRADTNFLRLSEDLVAIEDQLQYARRYYNGSVRDFRNLAQTFPQNLVAAAFAFHPGEFFEVDSATERAAPAVTL